LIIAKQKPFPYANTMPMIIGIGKWLLLKLIWEKISFTNKNLVHSEGTAEV